MHAKYVNGHFCAVKFNDYIAVFLMADNGFLETVHKYIQVFFIRVYFIKQKLTSSKGNL